MNLQLPIVLNDEVGDLVITSRATLDLASGEIRDVVYDDYDVDANGLPAGDPDYDFTSGLLAYGDKEVEFRVEADAVRGLYSITPSELLELKGRAAKLFTAPPGKAAG